VIDEVSFPTTQKTLRRDCCHTRARWLPVGKNPYGEIDVLGAMPQSQVCLPVALRCLCLSLLPGRSNLHRSSTKLLLAFCTNRTEHSTTHIHRIWVEMILCICIPLSTRLSLCSGELSTHAMAVQESRQRGAPDWSLLPTTAAAVQGLKVSGPCHVFEMTNQLGVDSWMDTRRSCIPKLCLLPV
jgi:hypothetical protein